MICSACKQPMVDPDDGTLIHGTKKPYSGRLCLDCLEIRAKTPADDWDCWQYMTRRRIPSKLRDAASLYR